MKKLAAILLTMSLAVGMLAGCGGSSAPAASGGGDSAAKKEYKLRLGTHFQEGHAILDATNAAAKLVEEKTNGQVKITVYPASQLGDYTLTYEELMKGTIDMAVISIPSQYDPQLEMNFIPYLVTGYDQVEKAFGPGSYFFEKYTEVHKNLGVKLIGVYSEGFIGLGMNTLAADYADPASKKPQLVRAPNIEVYKLAVEDNGYTSTTIPYADLYSALQTGVCDGWIGGSPQLNYTGFRDVIKYYIPTNVFMENGGVFMSQKVYDEMPEDLRSVIEETFMQEVVLKSYADAQANDLKAIEDLKAYGVEIKELSDSEMQALVDHAKAVTWPKLEGNIGADVLENLEKDLAG